MIFFKKKRKKPKNPIDKIDKFVICVMVYWLLFVVVMTIIFCFKGIVPDTLIQYALGGGAIELVCTALIEIMKDREGKKKDERDNLHGDQADSSGACISGDDVPDSVAAIDGGRTDDVEGEVLG